MKKERQLAERKEKELTELKDLFTKGLITEDIYNQRQLDILQKTKYEKQSTAGDSTDSEDKPYVAPTPMPVINTLTPTPVIISPPTFVKPLVRVAPGYNPDPGYNPNPGYNPDPGYDDRPVPRSPRKCNCNTCCECDFSCIDVGTPNWGCSKWFLWVIALLIVVAAQAVGVIIGIVNLVALFSEGPIPFFNTDDNAKGFIAIGGTATGFIAIGQFATGFVTIGQFTFGFINLSMIGVGILANVSMVGGSIGFAVGMLQIGGYVVAAVFGVALVYVRRAVFGINIIAPFFHTEDDRKFTKMGCQKKIKTMEK